jgi:hypothetical protein
MTTTTGSSVHSSSTNDLDKTGEMLEQYIVTMAGERVQGDAAGEADVPLRTFIEKHTQLIRVTEALHASWRGDLTVRSAEIPPLERAHVGTTYHDTLYSSQERTVSLGKGTVWGRASKDQLLRWATHSILMIVFGVAIGGVATFRLLPARGRPSSYIATDTMHFVRFFLKDMPGMTTVTLAGNFDGRGMSRTPLRFDRTHGVWWGAVALAPGEYRYHFVVDDTETVLDPRAPAMAGEGGRTTSIVVVPGVSGVSRARFPHDT